MRHSEKSENITQGRRSLVIASQAVGVVAVYRRRFNNFRIGNYCPDLEFHFRTLEFDFRQLEFNFRTLEFNFRTLEFNFWTLEFNFRMLKYPASRN